MGACRGEGASRFASALAALAVAALVVAHGLVLPGALLQLHDPRLLGGVLLHALVHTAGFAFALALCAAFTGLALLLASRRTRERGAPDTFAALTAIVIAACLFDRVGIGLQPIAWAFTALVALMLEWRERRAWYAVVPVLYAWGLIDGAATFGALLAVIAAAGATIDSRQWSARLRDRWIVAAASIPVVFVDGTRLSATFYGARALYLDGLLPGAERLRLFTAGAHLPAIALLTLVVLAAWYGVRRKHRAADALIFAIGVPLAVLDARMLPFVALVLAPVVADAMASYYVHRRTVPAASFSTLVLPALAAVAAFVMVVTIAEPRRFALPDPPGAPVALAKRLAGQPGRHRVVCAQPIWCDAVSALARGNVVAVMDGRGGHAAPSQRHIQARFEGLRPGWQAALRAASVSAVIAAADSPATVLLQLSGRWRAVATDGSHRTLLEYRRRAR
ncbi:MAG: hypothetical protein ACYDEW_06710 [Vulcanimicrobiaceae bacterium]